MNKQELIEFINGLPDNLEVEPMTLDETVGKKVNGSVFGTEYGKCVDRLMTLRLHFKSEVQSEFEVERNQYGFPCIVKSMS